MSTLAKGFTQRGSTFRGICSQEFLNQGDQASPCGERGTNSYVMAQPPGPQSISISLIEIRVQFLRPCCANLLVFFLIIDLGNRIGRLWSTAFWNPAVNTAA